ncbi:MAG: hypothetical protein HY556_11330 [Euryarchaeota archaeon]|nr:hypothetical protein [Euryarchaeota archaeon]
MRKTLDPADKKRGMVRVPPFTVVLTAGEYGCLDGGFSKPVIPRVENTTSTFDGLGVAALWSDRARQ